MIDVGISQRLVTGFRVRCWSLILLVFLLVTPSAQSIEVSYEQAKTALIFKIINYVHWPNEESLQRIRLGLISDDQALLDEMRLAAQHIQVNGKPVEVDAIWGEALRRGEAKDTAMPELKKLLQELREATD